MSNKQHRLIVGVDFGTTFTGVGYVDSTKTSVNDVNIIRSWPGPSKDLDEVSKTPSRLAYVNENSSLISSAQWGYLVTPKMKSYSWMKLLLDRNTRPTDFDDPQLVAANDTEGNGMLRLPRGKGPTELCADYLWEIYKFVISTLEQRLSPEILKITPMEFWFTVPAIWSDKAKNSTKAAAVRAGFTQRPGDTIFMIPEPEAAAIATLSTLTIDGRDDQIKAGDGVIICDCGGGTVDITTYTIRSIEPVLEFEELIVGTGGKCGSTYVDRQFHEWLATTFGINIFKNIPFEKKGPGSRLMKEFESHKRDFGTSDDKKQIFEVPLVIAGAKNSEHYDADESLVKFTHVEMIKFFAPVINKIKAILKQQIMKANRVIRTGSINTVILVGGFGDSKYLNDMLRAWCEDYYEIRLLCPVHPQAAIVRGAALRGLQGTKPIVRRCRRNYGFDGDVIEETTQITSHITWTTSPTNAYGTTVDLYCCDHNHQPDYLTDLEVDHVGCIHVKPPQIDWSSFPTKVIQGVRKYKVLMKVQVLLGSKDGVLCFKVYVGDEFVGSTEIEYAKD